MILSTLDIKSVKHLHDTELFYLLFSIFCAIFGAVYEWFSHEVYAYSMLYAFMIPLIGGALPTLLLIRAQKTPPVQLESEIYRCGIITITVGTLVRGVLIIYGTSSPLCSIYPIVGLTFCALGVIIYGIRRCRVKAL